MTNRRFITASERSHAEAIRLVCIAKYSGNRASGAQVSSILAKVTRWMRMTGLDERLDERAIRIEVLSQLLGRKINSFTQISAGEAHEILDCPNEFLVVALEYFYQRTEAYNGREE